MATAKKAAESDEQQGVGTTNVNVFGIDDGRNYSSGSGFEAGQTAPSDKYLDRDSGKVVDKAPERGVLLAAKGEVVTPAMARRIADAKG